LIYSIVKVIYFYAESESGGRKERAECHLRRGDGFRNEEMRVLRGVVYMTKSSDPRTENWGDTAGGCVPGGQVSFTFVT